MLSRHARSATVYSVPSALRFWGTQKLQSMQNDHVKVKFLSKDISKQKNCDEAKFLSSSFQPPMAEMRFDYSTQPIQDMSTREAIRGWLVFKMLTYDKLVDNSLKYYKLSKRILGSWLTEKLLRLTIFGHFAGGVDEVDAEKTVRRLAERNVSSIWYHSAEQDLKLLPIPKTQADLIEQEKLFDRLSNRCLKSIEMSATCNREHPLRFTAIKMTAIVHPDLLHKLNSLLTGSKGVFSSLATPGKYTVDRIVSPATLHEVIPEVKIKGTLPDGNVGIADWQSYFTIANGLQSFQQLKMLPPDLTYFSDMEQEQFSRFIARLTSIGESAKSKGVTVLVDAEQTHFQVAIEHLTLHLLSRWYNSTRPLFYNTIQTYLTNSYDCTLMHQAISKQYGIISGIKLVRGCYLEYERKKANALGEDSPVHNSKSNTDNSYHHALAYLMKEVQNNAAHIIVASHNKETIKSALKMMKDCEIAPDDGKVAFGQLLGMSDHLTYPLGSAGYHSNKVVAFGSMEDIVPFLSRRAHENRGMIKNAQEELSIYSQEIKRRFLFLRK